MVEYKNYNLQKCYFETNIHYYINSIKVDSVQMLIIDIQQFYTVVIV